jgi:hypothetical protein
VELCVHSTNTPSWRGAELKHRDCFTFTFYLNFNLELCSRPFNSASFRMSCVVLTDELG